MQFYKDIKETARAEFLIEPSREDEDEIEVTRQHIAFIKILDNRGRPYIPLAVVEDLHLPFEPGKSEIFRNC